MFKNVWKWFTCCIQKRSKCSRLDLFAVNVREMFKNVREMFRMFKRRFTCSGCSWTDSKCSWKCWKFSWKDLRAVLIVNEFLLCECLRNLKNVWEKCFTCCDCSRTNFCSVNVWETLKMIEKRFSCCDCSRTAFCSVNIWEPFKMFEKIYFVVFLVRCSKMVLKRAVIVKCSKCFQDSKCFLTIKMLSGFLTIKIFSGFKMFLIFQNVFNRDR